MTPSVYVTYGHSPHGMLWRQLDDKRLGEMQHGVPSSRSLVSGPLLSPYMWNISGGLLSLATTPAGLAGCGLGMAVATN
jgi:hypothetical protein